MSYVGRGCMAKAALGNLRAFLVMLLLALAIALVLPMTALAAGDAGAADPSEERAAAPVAGYSAITVELEGIKILEGRDWRDGEASSFVLRGLDGAPMPEEAQGFDAYEFEVGRTSSQLNIGIFGIFIDFDTPGTYEYELSEVRGDTPGIVYDEYMSAITVTIFDDGEGGLVSQKVVQARTDIEVEANVSGFLNRYVATVAYPGLTIEKTLLGRDAAAGEFEFEITCMNPNAKMKGISAEDARFASVAGEAGKAFAMSGKLAGVIFDQGDSGKEFIYEVTEVLPDDDAALEGVQLRGVTYDEMSYWVVIVPIDNGDGSMKVTTRIYADESRAVLLGSYSTENRTTAVLSFVNSYEDPAEDPVDPGNPGTPGAPGAPGAPGEGSVEPVIPATGDGSSALTLLAVALASAAALAVAARRAFVRC